MINSYAASLLANVPARFNVQGSYFRLISGNAIDVTFFLNGSIVGSSAGMNAGFYTRMPDGAVFNGVEVVSATPQNLSLLIGSAEAGTASAVSISGFVPVTMPVTPFSQTGVTVGIVSGQIRPANAARKFLMVQNKDAVANVFINLAGAAAAVADGIRLPPGGSMLLDVATPSGAIFAIADVATAAGAVTVVEG